MCLVVERKCTFSDIRVLSLYLSNGFPILHGENNGAELSHSAPLSSTVSRGAVQSQSTTALVERTGNHVELLFLGELDEVHRVAGDTHGQVRVLLRVIDGILELFLA